jgi:hypothetical protein
MSLFFEEELQCQAGAYGITIRTAMRDEGNFAGFLPPTQQFFQLLFLSHSAGKGNCKWQNALISTGGPAATAFLTGIAADICAGTGSIAI